MVRVAIDTKNFALHGGGISHFFAPVLADSLGKAWPDTQFIFVGPRFDLSKFGLQDFSTCMTPIEWPGYLPRPLQHPFYDNVVFPRAMRCLKPDVVISPYHDVRVPRKTLNLVTVHDLCLMDLSEAYPAKIRAYYNTMLKINLARAAEIITVSETTRAQLISRLHCDPARVSVVYNTLAPEFAQQASREEIEHWRQRHQVEEPFLLYSSGIEYRKNIPRLLQALATMGKKCPLLLVTGKSSALWETVQHEIPEEVRQKIRFLGYLSLHDMKLAYESASAVVFPSLGEGFGRACLEAMSTGTPLVCSDLPVFREVSGDYPVYVDPRSVDSIAEGILEVMEYPKRSPVLDTRFTIESACKQFSQVLERTIDRARHVR